MSLGLNCSRRKMAKYTVREGTREDCREIRRLIQSALKKNKKIIRLSKCEGLQEVYTATGEHLALAGIDDFIMPILPANQAKELANFEKFPDGPKLTEEDLQRDGFDLQPPLFQIFVAENEDRPGILVGYALYYYTYSTWTGRRMYLRDICVTESHRGSGFGYALIRKVIERAVEMKCSEMDFIVVDWNPARTFYFKVGAIDISETGGWRLFRMHRPEMVALVSAK